MIFRKKTGKCLTLKILYHSRVGRIYGDPVFTFFTLLLLFLYSFLIFRRCYVFLDPVCFFDRRLPFQIRFCFLSGYHAGAVGYQFVCEVPVCQSLLMPDH